MDTRLAREARKLSFSQKQLMFIIGSILGDGYLDTTTRGYSLRIHHGITQKEYVDFKYLLVSSFVNSKPKKVEMLIILEPFLTHYLINCEAFFIMTKGEKLFQNYF